MLGKNIIGFCSICNKPISNNDTIYIYKNKKMCKDCYNMAKKVEKFMQKMNK